MNKLADGSKDPWWDPKGKEPNKTFPLFGSELVKGWDTAKAGIIVEGEKAALSLTARGYQALATYGTSHTPPNTALRPLLDFPVYLWPDNDAPGREHMDRIGAALAALGNTPFVIAWPDAPPKGDAADFKGDVDELLRDAVPWEPRQTSQQVAVATSVGLRLTLLADLLAEPAEAIPWLWDKTLPAGGLSLLAAKPKVGKSTLARNLALAVARGDPFLGRESAAGPVVYLALEEKRQQVQEHFNGLGGSDERIYVHVGGAPEEALEALRSAVMETGARLAIVDPLFKLVRFKDGNDYSEASRALEPLLQLARDTGCHIMLVHHLGKGEREGGDSILGSTAIFAAVDTAIIERKRQDGTRTIESIQRYGEDLPKTALQFDADNGRVSAGGTVEELDVERAKQAIRDALQQGEQNQADLRSLEGHRTIHLHKALSELVNTEEVKREGTGKKGDAYRYSINACLLVPSSKEEQREQQNKNLSVPDPSRMDGAQGGSTPDPREQQSDAIGGHLLRAALSAGAVLLPPGSPA